MSEIQQITTAQADFVEKKAEELFKYTVECMDRARSEGNNVLQWLFGVITGGMGLIGALQPKGHFELAAGTACAIGAASYAAVKLVRKMKSRDTSPPGNLSASLNTMLDEPAERMRWREACGLDARIQTNLQIVASLADAVDSAREQFARIPAWFIGGTLAAFLLVKIH